MITRRRFNAAAVSAALSVPLKKAFPLGASLSDSSLPDASLCSSDADFTPFGYLDNPYHCWNLHASGVFRSLPGVGFGLYYPAGPGGYFNYKTNGVYHATLRLGFVFGERRLWAPEDYREGELVAVHHSKDVFTYRVSVAGHTIDCTFFQCGEDTLAVRVEGKANSPRDSFRLIAIHEYQLGGASWWGGDGIAASFDAESGAWVTQGFAGGTVFVTGSDSPVQNHFVNVVKDADQALDENRNSNAATAYEKDCLRAGSMYEIRSVQIERGITIYMSRGVNRTSALAEMKRSKEKGAEELDHKRTADRSFWKDAPQLVGAWPRHWKNGWIYDFETLRMMVRRPIGIYRHPWDGMQIQAPRSVLAETSIDMWALSYVDAEAAKAVFLGQFKDAIAKNVPCAREDGSTNMVATDGSECGTSISWCYPFFCARAIYERTGDRAWMEEVYAELVSFLEWTLQNRSDHEKFIIAKCSWESGMDGSKRFLIDEPTGGETAEFARLVELQAATAQAAAILASFAGDLGKHSDVKRWQEVKETYSSKTQTMWNGRDWFNDFDTRSMKPITSVGRDVGQVAPIFCEIATSAQTAKMLPSLREFYQDSVAGKMDMGQDPLLWSSLLLPYAESLWTAGELELVANVIHTIAERIYTSMDRRTVEAKSMTGHLGWPGVSCEVWGPDGARGGEGYGWGAVMPAHIVRNLLGVRETDNSGRVILAPNLPDAFMKNGEFGINNLAFRQGRLSLQYEPMGSGKLKVIGTCTVGVISVDDPENGSHLTLGYAREFKFEARNRHVYRLNWK